MFKFTEPGCQVEGWVKAQQSSRPESRRRLRQRKCNPPRLTTKIANTGGRYARHS